MSENVHTEDAEELPDDVQVFWITLEQRVEAIRRTLEIDPDIQDTSDLMLGISALNLHLSNPFKQVNTATKQFLQLRFLRLQEILGFLNHYASATESDSRESLRRSTVHNLTRILGELHRRAFLAIKNERSPDSFQLAENALLESFRLQAEDALQNNRQLQNELSELTLAKIQLEEALQRQAAEHEKAKVLLNEQLNAEIKESIEAKTTVFVDAALATLEINRTEFATASKRWSRAAYSSLAFGVLLSVYLGIKGSAQLLSHPEMQWTLLAFFSAKGAVLLALLFSVLRYCSSQGRNFMHESLKSAERMHAINYGKFYLSVFGTAVGDEKVKEAFSQWNITTNTAFSAESNRPPVDLNAHSSLAQSVIEKLVDKIPSVNVK